jgi:hypothetical protein
VVDATISGGRLSREGNAEYSVQARRSIAAGWLDTSFDLIWDKTGGSAVANSDATPECHEYVLHMIKWSSKSRRPYGNTKPLKSSILRHHAVAHPKHGCVFPVSLVEELLSACPARPVIIDPYIGSGTVAVAARSVSKATVHGFDLDCSTAREALPEAVCNTSSQWHRRNKVTTSVRRPAR